MKNNKKATAIYKALIFTLFSFAGLCLQVEQKFCFSNKTSLNIVIKDIQKLLLPSDKFFKDQNDQFCLIGSIGSSRVELIEKYLKMNYELVQVYSKSPNQVSSRSPMCRLYVTRNQSINANAKSGRVSTQGTKAKQTNLNSNSKTESMIVLTSGRTGRLKYDGQDLEVVCLKRGQIIELTFSLAADKGASVQTAVSLAPGQTLNIADVVKDLNKKGSTVYLLGAEGSKTQGKETEQVIIRVE